MKIKGFDKDLKCRGYQFEIGKVYDTGAADDTLQLCSDKVFHYCDSFEKVHRYYSALPSENNRFCEIEVLGAEISNSKKCGSNKIRILREITGDELDIMRGSKNGNAGLFNTGNRNTGDCNTGDFNTGNFNTGYHNTGNFNTGNRNTGNCNTGDCNTGYHNTGNCNTGNRNTGNRNTGNYNTGAFNICDFSSGFFCTEEPKARIFDVETDMTVSEFYVSKYYLMLMKYPINLTEWCEYTDKEKADDDEKKNIGGYLKKYTFQEACRIWWDKYGDDEKSVIMSIPNFDAEKFKLITGIDIKQ